MPRLDAEHAGSNPRRSEQGNIALVTALLVMALAGVGIGMARLVQMRTEATAEMRLSNYAATLAQNVAEAGINQVIFNWANGTPQAGTAAVAAPGVYPGVGTLTTFGSLVTNYPSFSVGSNCTYTVAVADAGANWTVTAVGTVTANGALLPSATYRIISRTVVATVDKATFAVVGYTR